MTDYGRDTDLGKPPETVYQVDTGLTEAVNEVRDSVQELTEQVLEIREEAHADSS